MRLIKANWLAPAHISAVTTTRQGGSSQPPYDSNNLALHVGDNANNVLDNRKDLAKHLKLPAEPVWLNQTHSIRCINPEKSNNRDADAAVSRSMKYPLVIMTADCLPIVLTDRHGNEIAAIHAGWKGLVDGIIENTLKQLNSMNKDLIVWTGPHICANCFELGKEVYDNFIVKYPFLTEAFFAKKDKYFGDLAKIAQLILQNQGVTEIFSSKCCTFESKNHYYSYRRASQTGRIATLVWFNQ